MIRKVINNNIRIHNTVDLVASISAIKFTTHNQTVSQQLR